MKYMINSVKVWGGNKTEKRDDDGYMMMSLALEGQGEPVDYKSKTQPREGNYIEGELVAYTTQSGNDRTRLETLEYKKRENSIQDKIVAQFALRLAVEHSADHLNKEDIMETARFYIECVNELAS